MAITKSATKTNRADQNKRVFNLRRSRTMKASVKEFNEAVAGKQKGDAEALLPKVYQALDKAAKRGIIKANAASRTKSRLVAKLRKIEG